MNEPLKSTPHGETPAARGRTEVSAQAMAILDDPERSFASSDFVRLEVLPKALFNRKSDEAEFYPEFFLAVSYWPPNTDAVVRYAYETGVKFGLAALDALHVAAAIMAGAEEIDTTEKRSKPLHRTADIRVRSIQTDSA
jgi:predicted nucleic acid-binding protein